MSVRQTIKRHYKIISLLRLRAMSYEEVQEEMNLDPDSREESLMTSQRTFQRDILDIASIYGIEIESDRSQSKYFIKDDLEETHSQRLRENFEILNAIRLSKSLGNSLVFEERRSLGTQNMAGLLHAIQNRLKVTFDYHKFYDDTDSKREVMPIALKEARNRWYLIGKDLDSTIKNFALDRIVSLLITEIKFKPIAYNVHKEYRDCFGIINGTGEETVEVTLSFHPKQGLYIKSLPLHHSQKLLMENEDELRFKYFIRPTYDFKMELLSYGDQVRVVEPKSLRIQIQEQLKNALNAY